MVLQFPGLGCVSKKFVETVFDCTLLAIASLTMGKEPANFCRLPLQPANKSNQMPKPIFLRLPDGVAQKLLTQKPESLSLSTFCSLLLEQAVDTPVTLAERAKASVASNSSSISINLEEELNTSNQYKLQKSKKKRVRPEYDEAFTAFWNEYQRAPIKANAQSKNRAFEQWKEAVKLETPERLLEAARRAVEQVKQAKIQDEWCAPLPDAFRWLRDERFTVYLEDHVPVGPRVINGYTVYE